MTLYKNFTAQLGAALDRVAAVADAPRGNVTVEPPRDPSHGDLSTNAAMVLAKGAGMAPRALAELLKPELAAVPGVTSVEIAGPGFINLRLADDIWRAELTAIHAGGADYGRSDLGGGSMVNIEYVSANPTGPMHMGHCRGAVIGDALAGLLEWAGHRVTKEYYVNDAGGQVDVLARSVHIRYREALGEGVGAIPEGLYPGDYLVPVGQALAAEFGDTYVGKPEGDWLALFRTRAVAAMLELIKADLALLGVHHDVFSSEAAVQAAQKPEAAEARLRAEGLIYDGVLERPKGEVFAAKPAGQNEPDGWQRVHDLLDDGGSEKIEPEPVVLPLFRSTEFGDDQDRAIRKSDGSWTYFGADMAYHFQKSETADALIDIWGADHAGTVKRIRAAVSALTGGKPFDVKLIQMVRLLRNGEPVKMSKRSGNFVTLAEVVNEVGKDVVRFTMLTRKADAQMDFDFAKVVEASKDNPVFYVQYAHARIKSIGRKAAEADVAADGAAIARLDAEDLELVKLAAQFPRIVESAALAREPHRIAFYLYDLAAAFHGYFNLGHERADRRVVMVNDRQLSAARLFLVDGIGQIIRNGLSIMGVAAVEEM